LLPLGIGKFPSDLLHSLAFGRHISAYGSQLGSWGLKLKKDLRSGQTAKISI